MSHQSTAPQSIGPLVPEARFNDSQLQALDLSSHVAITAAAGSGKTTVLVERFVRILERTGFHPERIVSITFTEEAASQMKERIRSAVEARALARDREAPGETNLWRRALRFLSLAKITTIHGFCLSLLGEYPLDAGLDPGFQVLGPAEQQLLLEESVVASMREFSRSGHPDLAALLDYASRAQLESILRQMVGRRNYLGRLSPEEASMERLVNTYQRETAVQVLRLAEWERLEEALEALPGRLLRDSSSCARRCQRQKVLFQERKRFSQVEFLTAFEETFSIRISPSRTWKESGRYDQLKELWDSLKKEVRKRPLSFEAASPAEERHFQRAVNSLRSLYGLVLEGFRHRKKERGLVDFEDLLDLTSQLLKKETVRLAVQERYEYFLVDEFQDTNHVQWEILRPLLGPRSNLLAVGDAKQSIYRFRDADVSIFQEVQEWVGTRGRIVEMPENYRSLPELVAFCNQVFAGLFLGGPSYEATHQTMRACREAGATGRVEVYFSQPEEEISEPELAAEWIQHLIEGGRRPGEIAILLRARTRLKEYERALRGRGLAFHTVGGVGFHERQEVTDLLNVVRFLVDPGNEVALAGVLRGPIFSLSDEEIFAVSLSQGADLWEKLQHAALGPAPVPAHWGFAARRLAVWIEWTRKEKVAALLRRVLRDSGCALTLANSRDGSQCLDNVAKFLEMAREFERRQRRGPRQFLAFVEALRKSEANEPESVPASPRADRVRIYTIHGAKGLQFPVVVLPDLGSPLTSAPTDPFLCETVRTGGRADSFLGLKIRNPDDHYRELNHPVHRMLQKLDQYRRIAEEKRLLYVACTRAEDHLILIGRKGEPLSCAGWLVEAGADSWQIGTELRSRLMPDGVGEVGLTDAQQIEIRSLEDVPESVVSIDLPAIVPPPPPSWRKQVWTPTEIAKWSLCPRSFHLSSVEGLDEDHPLSAEPLGTPAALVGSAVHDILEKASGLLEGREIEARIEAWSGRFATLFPDRDPSSLRTRLEKHLAQVRRHPFGRRMAIAERIFHEKPFNVQFQDLRITGVIDRLFEEADGRWVVVDFKTNQIGSREIDRKVRDLAYDLQVQMYLWAVSRILGTSQVEGVLFFTDSGVLKPVPFDESVSSHCTELLRRLPRSSPPTRFPKTDRPSLCSTCGFLQSGICTGATPTQRGFGELWSEPDGGRREIGGETVVSP